METIAPQGAAHHEPHPLQHMSWFRSEQQRGKSSGQHLHKGTAGDRRGPFSLSHQQSRWSWERVWSFLEPNFSSVRMLHLLTVPPSQTLLSRLPGFWARVVVVV